MIEEEYSAKAAAELRLQGRWPKALILFAARYPETPMADALGSAERKEILDDELRDRLQKLLPLMTWREALYHFLGSL